MNYQRPKDFVDPFAPKEEDELESPKTHRMTSSHLGRIRRLRSPEKLPPVLNEAASGNLQPKDEARTEFSLEQELEGSLYKDGIYELDSVRRFTTVTDSDGEVSTQVLLEISCLLIEGATIVITAIGSEEENGIEAEAEIGLDELLSLKNCSDFSIKDDLPQLRKLIVDLLDSIEVRIEEGIARLVLSLSSDPPIPSDPKSVEAGVNVSDDVISEENEYADDEFD